MNTMFEAFFPVRGGSIFIPKDSNCLKMFSCDDGTVINRAAPLFFAPASKKEKNENDLREVRHIV